MIRPNSIEDTLTEHDGMYSFTLVLYLYDFAV